MLPPKTWRCPNAHYHSLCREPGLRSRDSSLLAAAFENAWESLTARSDRLAHPLKAAHSREVLAKRIIDLAQRGERDSIRLRDDALAYLRIKTYLEDDSAH